MEEREERLKELEGVKNTKIKWPTESMKGSCGVSETEATNLGIQWFFTGPLFICYCR